MLNICLLGKITYVLYNSNICRFKKKKLIHCKNIQLKISVNIYLFARSNLTSRSSSSFGNGIIGAC